MPVANHGRSPEADDRRTEARAEALLDEEAFLDNDYVPGELGRARPERIAHERAAHDEGDFDAESESEVRRADLREKLQADRLEDVGGPRPEPSEEEVLEDEADTAKRIADETAHGHLDGKEEGPMNGILELFTWVNIRFLLQGLGMTPVHFCPCHRVLDRIGYRHLHHAHVEQPRAAWCGHGLHRDIQEHPAAPVDHVHVLRGAAAADRCGRVGVHAVHQRERGPRSCAAVWRACRSASTRAAKSQGFSTVQTYLLIILPQALRNMVPALLSQFVTTIKDTSYLWGAMALQELMGRGMILMNSYNSTAQIFAIFGIMALIYFVVCFALSQVVRAYQRRLKEAHGA